VGVKANKGPKVQNNRIRQAGTTNAYSPPVNQQGKQLLEIMAHLENKKVCKKIC
jgi:hypothetical protein